MKKEIKGVLQNAYFDSDMNVKAFIILFTSGAKCLTPVFLNSLNGHIKEGDSIYKKSGNFIFEIYRKGDSIPIIIVDTVDCNKISF